MQNATVAELVNKLGEWSLLEWSQEAVTGFQLSASLTKSTHTHTHTHTHARTLILTHQLFIFSANHSAFNSLVLIMLCECYLLPVTNSLLIPTMSVFVWLWYMKHFMGLKYLPHLTLKPLSNIQQSQSVLPKHFNLPMRDLKFQPRLKWDLRSFGILRRVEWQFVTDVSGQPIGPLKIVERVCPETSVTNYHPALPEIA